MLRWIFCVIVILGFLQAASSQGLKSSPAPTQKKIHADLIVVKLKKPNSSQGRIGYSAKERLSAIKDLTGYQSDHKVFSGKAVANGRSATSHLDNIYKLKFNPGTNIWRAISRLQKLDYIEYAEPLFQNELLLVPNDPQANPSGGQQDYLTVIKAYDGWQIDQSDSTMVIGIVDTGVNLAHEDLGSISLNYGDPINGLDDDGDGYIDNYHGWDIANDDNDPTADSNPHGTHVTGISAAETNNGIGMAGIGFHSTYLPVNAWNSTYKRLLNEYEGIIYAADRGARVINLSWGGPDLYSQYGQDIINYAVLERDVVIVSAAGNTHAELEFYPASFDNVLSVGATDMEDNMATWATYSHFIDVMAPGQKIYSTKNNGGYEKSGGSSFAAPMVAGAAALVRSHFPNLSAIQVMEQIRVTADDIYSVGSNMNYFGKMGRGRLNVHGALSDILTPSIRLSEYLYNGKHGSLLFPGDSVELRLKFTNYLRLAENVTITISNPSSNVSWEVNQIFIDILQENESFENADMPIHLMVNEDIGESERLIFRIDYVGNNYTDFEYFEIEAAPAYFNISDGNITATITSDGDIGYDSPFYRHGDGIVYQENHIASNTGLIISYDSLHVLSNVINNFENFTRDEDFVAETAISLFDNSVADDDARSVYVPVDRSSTSLDIKIEQKILSWENPTNDGYLVFEYRIINTGDSTLNGINTGLYADWDLGDFKANAAAWDAQDDFGYVFDKTEDNLYAGIALISDQTKTHFAIDLDSLNGNIADLGPLFTDTLKHKFLSQLTKDAAGTKGSGNDVAHIVGSKALNIESNQSVKLTFVMLSSSSLEGLRNALNLAKANYINYLEDPPLLENFYACSGDSAAIDPIGEIFEFYEDASAIIRIDSGYSMKTKPLFSSQEYYVINLDSGYAADLAKVVVKPEDAQAIFDLSADTLLIESGQSSSLTIQNNSQKSDQWNWDFGNGYSSTVEHPTTSYDTPGLFAIELIASNSYGCKDTLRQNMLVATRLERPSVENQEICKGTSTTIAASNTNLIEVYNDPELTELMYRGDIYVTNKMLSDHVYYVVNVDGDFESAASSVTIEVKHPITGFYHQVDTTDLTEKYVMLIQDFVGDEDNVSWMIDNQLLGTGTSITYSYTEDPFEIAQIKTDSEGCADTLRQMVIPELSDQPVVEDVWVCKNSSFTIIPQSGQVFYFYADMALSQLIHKGSRMTLTDISEAEQYYVTNADKFLEGPYSVIQVNPDPLKAIIQSSSDKIDLAETDSVELQNLSENAARSYWLSSGGTFDITKIITENYHEPGNFEYTLVAESSSGCYDTATQTIEVILVTGLESGLLDGFKIYPNPVEEHLTIELGRKSNEKVELEIIDLYGRIQRSFTLFPGQSRHEVNLASLDKGVYFIRSQISGKLFTSKIIKR